MGLTYSQEYETCLMGCGVMGFNLFFSVCLSLFYLLFSPFMDLLPLSY